MSNYFHVTDNCPDGAMIGNSTTSKIAFFGGTPDSQKDASTAATAFDVASIGVTPATVDATSWGFDSSAHALAFVTALSTAVTQINAIQTDLVSKGYLGSP